MEGRLRTIKYIVFFIVSYLVCISGNLSSIDQTRASRGIKKASFSSDSDRTRLNILIKANLCSRNLLEDWPTKIGKVSSTHNFEREEGFLGKEKKQGEFIRSKFSQGKRSLDSSWTSGEHTRLSCDYDLLHRIIVENSSTARM